MYTCISCISYNSTINTYKFKRSVEVYPIDVNPIEVYPIEAYLIGKGVVEVSGRTYLYLIFSVLALLLVLGPLLLEEPADTPDH